MIRVSVFLLSLCISLQQVEGSREEDDKCTLPKLGDVDWNMFPDEWYQVLNVGDAVVKNVPCWSFKNVKETSNGVYIEFKHTYQSKGGSMKYDFVPVHWFTRGNSIDNLDPKYEYLWLDAARKMGQGETALKEIGSWYRTKVAHISDYENYVIWFQCGADGKRYIWVYIRTPQPTAEDILLVHNRLVQIGGGWGKVKLNFADCVRFKMPQNKNVQ